MRTFEAVDEADTNKDHLVDVEELKTALKSKGFSDRDAGGQVKEIMNLYDENKDGYLDQGERAAFLSDLGGKMRMVRCEYFMPQVHRLIFWPRRCKSMETVPVD